MKVYLVLIFFCFFYSAIQAQNLAEDLMQIQRVHSGDKQFSYKMKIVYGDRKTNSLIDSSFGEYSFYKRKYFVSLEGIKSVSDGNVLVSVNEEMKGILVSKASADARKQVSFNFLDSVIVNSKIISKIVFNKNNTRTYTLYSVSDAIDSIRISFNTERFTLKLISVYYNTPINDLYDYIPIVKYEYSDYLFSDVELKDKYNVNKYLNITNSVVQLTPKYKKYSLINHLRF